MSSIAFTDQIYEKYEFNQEIGDLDHLQCCIILLDHVISDNTVEWSFSVELVKTQHLL